jgi:peptide/nickel transport system substrate-binding protein
MLTRRDALKLGMIGTAAVVADVEAQPKAPWLVRNDHARSPVRGGYFRRAAAFDVGLLNPHHWPVNDWLVISQIYDKLLLTDGTYRPVPWLAESWTFPTPVTCVMTLRKHVEFADSSPFNAAAVKFVLDWIVEPKSGCWDAGLLKPLKSIDVLDEYTVRWNFREPSGGFLGVMAGVPGYMLSPKALAGDLRRADTQPVGTGPYILEDRSPGAWIKVRRNPNWWFGKSIGKPDMPYFDGVITTVIPDPSIQVANFRAGKLDGIVIGKSLYGALKRDPNAETYAEPANHLRGYIFNHTRPPFNDIRARQAVAYAIDRNALIAGIEFGMGRIASCLYPDDHWAHNPNLSPWRRRKVPPVALGSPRRVRPTARGSRRARGPDRREQCHSLGRSVPLLLTRDAADHLGFELPRGCGSDHAVSVAYGWIRLRPFERRIAQRGRCGSAENTALSS